MAPPSEDRVMSPATASVAVDKVFRSVPEPPEILFFGGEPLMGFPAIEKAVQTSEEYCAARRAPMPSFGIATNGILIDKETIEFFKQHHFSVTVSLDGPRRIHDRQRQFPSGKGTYDIVKKKIDLLRRSGVEIEIQAVFTDQHRKCKETIESTYASLLALGARNIALTPAIGGLPDECIDRDFLIDLEQSYSSSTGRIMDTWLTDSPIKIPHWLDLLETLISRKGSNLFCGAGNDGITVDCAGRVFPCHTLMSNSLYMGSVNDRDFPGEDFRRVTALMQRTTKDSFPKCVKCWAKRVCSPCYGDTFAAYGTLSAPRESMCTIIRSVIKATLLKVAEYMRDAGKWKRFIENVNRSNGRFTDTSMRAK
jgi:uncharacterized protein